MIDQLNSQEAIVSSYLNRIDPEVNEAWDKIRKSKKSPYMLRKIAKDLEVSKEEVQEVFKSIAAAQKQIKTLEEEYGYSSKALHELYNDMKRNEFFAERAKS